MPANAIACAGCNFPIPSDSWNREEGLRCPRCRHNARAFVFPAIDRNEFGVAPVAVEGEAEASCFYHPQSRAAVVCDDCGRFLCSLCELAVDGKHICPRCFDNAGPVDTRRTMYDTVALAISTFPAMMFWPAIISAPWALVTVFRRWNAPSSLVPRTKIRFILAALFALAEIGFIVFLIWGITQVGLKARRT